MFIIIIIIIRNGAKTISLQTSFGDLIIIIIIVITRFDCVWMQTQKSPNDPHIRIRGEKKRNNNNNNNNKKRCKNKKSPKLRLGT